MINTEINVHLAWYLKVPPFWMKCDNFVLYSDCCVMDEGELEEFGSRKCVTIRLAELNNQQAAALYDM